MSTVSIKQAEARAPEGLRDGGHHYPQCSNCDARLLDIWITVPDADLTWTIKANCPFCGDTSFQTKVRGMFHVGGYGVDKDDDPDDDVPSTTVDHFEEVDGVYIFLLKKANEHAKPVRR